MLRINNRRATALVLALALALTSYQSVCAQAALPPLSQTIPMQAETMEAYSNRQVHPFSSTKTENQFNTKGYIIIAKSQLAELFLNKQLHTIRLRDISTGYIWGALPTDEAEGLNKSWLSYGNSIAGIECFDE